MEGGGAEIEHSTRMTRRASWASHGVAHAIPFRGELGLLRLRNGAFQPLADPAVGGATGKTLQLSREGISGSSRCES